MLIVIRVGPHTARVERQRAWTHWLPSSAPLCVSRHRALRQLAGCMLATLVVRSMTSFDRVRELCVIADHTRIAQIDAVTLSCTPFSRLPQRWHAIFTHSHGSRVSKARFPLPELTARVNGPSWRVTGFHCPSTRPVNSGSGNRA